MGPGPLLPLLPRVLQEALPLGAREGAARGNSLPVRGLPGARWVSAKAFASPGLTPWLCGPGRLPSARGKQVCAPLSRSPEVRCPARTLLGDGQLSESAELKVSCGQTSADVSRVGTPPWFI